MKTRIVRTPSNDRQKIQLLELSDIPAPPTPTPGVIPSGFSMVLEFSGFNSDNALRHLNVGPAGGTDSASEQRTTAPFAGLVQTLIVQMDAGFPGTLGNPLLQTDFVVRKNGVGNDPSNNTALKVSFTHADNGVAAKNDLVHSFVVAAGDYIGVACDPTNMGGTPIPYAHVRMILVAT